MRLLKHNGFLNILQPPSTESVPELSSPPVLSGTGGVVPMLGEVPHPPPGLPIPQYNIGEYMGQHAWSANIIVSAINQPLEVFIHIIYFYHTFIFIVVA